MGLNMLTCPKVGSIDGIWDTRSNTCSASTRVDLLGEITNNGCGNGNSSHQISSLPAIYDEDVKLVNLRVRQRLKEQQTVDR
mmetsp:Transcript_41197/g.87786  ORF Transcript_41197/g.87786 Transcript_41197/m.87786 type:complete len:82 (-) Transcript_41197:841-1086(-)